MYFWFKLHEMRDIYRIAEVKMSDGTTQFIPQRAVVLIGLLGTTSWYDMGDGPQDTMEAAQSIIDKRIKEEAETVKAVSTIYHSYPKKTE